MIVRGVRVYKLFKRLFDIIFSLTGLIIAFPFLVIIAILIKVESKGPVIFKQERLGKNGKTFKIWKFRSMVVGAEKDGVYESKGDSRVTKIGRIIRKLSIDEFPQFINILKGDMSIIGPRPALTYHPWPLEDYTDFQRKRLNVRPGVTGYAQVNGRKNVEWNERIKLDVYYVENISFWLDTKIFFKTIKNILLMKDNYNEGKTVNNNLTLMYITNKPKLALVAEESGIDWIFVDLEIKGKEARQGHLDTVISKHSLSDIKPIKNVLTKSKLLVRVNPIDETSKIEIDNVITEGAEIVMLPFFKTSGEVKKFVDYVNKRAKVCLLLETPEAVENLDEILNIKGIDYIHIGLNDLHLGYERKFMFELLADGTVENIINKIKKTTIKYGFGGIARIGYGDLPAELIIMEHYRLKSEMAIVSRQFYDSKKIVNVDEVKSLFKKEVSKIRKYENDIKRLSNNEFIRNQNDVIKIVNKIIE